MCGITGIVELGGGKVDEALLARMTERLRHRGPDAVGLYVGGPVGLGHRRLSVIDVTSAANQPFHNDDRTVTLVFNGEIYNFQELRTQLEREGRRFHTRSDTEVLLRAWEHYGPDCATLLRGMFAFAIYDSRSRRLSLVRDRLGKKPLYFARTASTFFFASEIKALLACPGVDTTLDLKALGCYATYGFTLGEQSFYAGIRRVAPAYVLTIDLGNERPHILQKRYWSVEPCPDFGVSENEWIEELDGVLRTAVRLRMISDVPLGAFLSGGVDSSLVVAYMAEQNRDSVRTFTIGFEEKTHDESTYAERIAQRLGTRHATLWVRQDASKILNTLLDTYDEPFGDTSAIPTYYLCQEVHKHVTVAISGDGGDESFAGYSRYPYVYWWDRASRCITPMGRAAIRGLSGFIPRGSLLKRPLERCGFSGVRLYEHFMGKNEEFMGLLHRDVHRQAERGTLVNSLPDSKVISRIGLKYLCPYLDLNAYLPDDVLTKVDRASMAHGLEVRSPLLDQEVVELAARVPMHLKLRGLKGKLLLKKVLERSLPRPLFDRPKQGFGAPIGEWLRRGGALSEAMEEMFCDAGSNAWDYFDRDVVNTRYDEHIAGRADLSQGLWRVLFFHRWVTAKGRIG